MKKKTIMKYVDSKKLKDKVEFLGNVSNMPEYYKNLVKENGGRLTAKWVYGMVVYGENGAKEHTWSKSHFYFVDTASSKRNPGYPLDSLAVSLSKRRYLAYIAKDEEQRLERSLTESMVIDFIVRCVK